jgi:ferric-dicitrate binding protein FerR (iron transport regulator)
VVVKRGNRQVIMQTIDPSDSTAEEAEFNGWCSQACQSPQLLSGFEPGLQNMNAISVPPGSAAAAAAENLKEFTRQSVSQFSRLCQEFFDSERRELFEKEPSDADLEAHRTAIKWLLRAARAMLTMTSDPDFPDRSAANELEGRLIQLEHSWRQFQDSMPEPEAEKILASLFPGMPE